MGLAGCDAGQEVIACGACGSFAKKHGDGGVPVGCCGRGCVIEDKKCASGFHYVSADGESYAECAPVSECYYPDGGIEDDGGAVEDGGGTRAEPDMAEQVMSVPDMTTLDLLAPDLMSPDLMSPDLM